MGAPQDERPESRRRAAERRHAEAEVLRLRLAPGEPLSKGDLAEPQVHREAAEGGPAETG